MTYYVFLLLIPILFHQITNHPILHNQYKIFHQTSGKFLPNHHIVRQEQTTKAKHTKTKRTAKHIAQINSLLNVCLS